ncbi:hypothetical protein [Microbacterium gorillae]|uniref:hypothetical protein n=1 Tax=Microbacterium gorillae TaxID=1231063 RepID=UPI0005912D92|nr:hypothetical protein [Microbacterium gorillae]
MKRLGWSIVTMMCGVAAALIALLVEAHLLPEWFSILPVLAIPLAVLLSAFIGLMTASAVIMSPLVGIVAIVAPVIDWSTAPDIDEPHLIGFGPGVAFALLGLVALIAELRKRPQPAPRPVVPLFED